MKRLLTIALCLTFGQTAVAGSRFLVPPPSAVDGDGEATADIDLDTGGYSLILDDGATGAGNGAMYFGQDTDLSLYRSGANELTLEGNFALKGQTYRVIPTTHTPTGTTLTIDWDSGDAQVIDLGSASGDVTITFNNPNTGGAYILKIIQGATARNITWPGATKWPGGVAPVITLTNDAIDVVSFFSDGTNYYSAYDQDFQ